MPNVGASQPRNPGLLTPVTGNLFFVHSEIGFVGVMPLQRPSITPDTRLILALLVM